MSISIDLKCYKNSLENSAKYSICSYCVQRHIDVDDVCNTVTVEEDLSYPLVNGLFCVKLDDTKFAITSEETKFLLEDKYRYLYLDHDSNYAVTRHLNNILNVILKDVFEYIANNFINPQVLWDNQPVTERLKQYEKLSIYGTKRTCK